MYGGVIFGLGKAVGFNLWWMNIIFDTTTIQARLWY